MERPSRCGSTANAWASGRSRGRSSPFPRRFGRLRKLTTEIPAGGELPEEPAGIVTLANGILPKNGGLDYFTRRITFDDGIVANMIYWERLRGGRVFHAGSLGAGWGLSADPKFQALLRNVLHHFGVSAKGR